MGLGTLGYDLGSPVEGFAPEHVRVNAESVQIAAGPATLADFAGQSANVDQAKMKGTMVYPLGIAQDFALPQQKQVMSLSEIGSRRNFMVPGKSIASLSMSRALIYGPNLLRALYAWYNVNQVGGDPIASLIDGHPDMEPWTVNMSPGYENVFMNLESDMFDHPFGLLMTIRDTQGNFMYASYFETCYIQGYHTSPNASGMVMMENVSMLPERQVPVRVKAVGVSEARSKMTKYDTASIGTSEF
jgi:hypothetical protein